MTNENSMDYKTNSERESQKLRFAFPEMESENMMYSERDANTEEIQARKPASDLEIKFNRD